VGTGAADACAGNDSRLSDARTPSSHAIASHTTSGAGDGKILTASSTTEFGWEDPAPTWGQVTSKPSTFAPITGTGATDACAGNDSRLTNARTPTAHNLIDGTGHPVTGLTSGHVIRATGSTTYGFGAVAWADIDKTTSSLADITTKSHTALSDIGSNTHANIDTFIGTKAAASGLASLDSSSKVVQDPANATATPTASKIPLADGSGKLAAGWGGNASTLATLDSNSKVVQNPANATATATASKIPIADGSGKLDTWITYGTSSGTSCQGNDSRLSDTRTPSSHTIESHTATVTTGKILTGTGTNTYGWADPAPTWSQVSGKPTTFAPITGTNATDACAGNDARLSDPRTPTTHSHSASDVSAGTFAAGTYTFETVALTKSSSCAVSTLTDASTVTPNFAASNNFTWTLGDNRTLANPTNKTVGQSGLIFLIQDATGNRTLSYGTYYDFPDGTAPALSTAANSVDVLSYFVRTSTSICCQLVRAFS
jgi:hypothetical protein